MNDATRTPEVTTSAAASAEDRRAPAKVLIARTALLTVFTVQLWNLWKHGWTIVAEGGDGRLLAVAALATDVVTAALVAALALALARRARQGTWAVGLALLTATATATGVMAFFTPGGLPKLALLAVAFTLSSALPLSDDDDDDDDKDGVQQEAYA